MLTFLFYAIALLITVATAMAVTRRNMVHAVLYLVLSFFGTAMLFYLLGAPFLAALEIIIYAGAIMVLFLFLIMMIRLKKMPGMFFPAGQLLPAIFISAGFLVSHGAGRPGHRGMGTAAGGPGVARDFRCIPVPGPLAGRGNRLHAAAGGPGRRLCARTPGSSTVRRPATGGAVIVPLNHILLLSALLFTLGMFCTLARRNLIMMLLGIEIMLNAAAIGFVGAALHWQQMEGQAIVIFILAVAATEVSVGLAAILVVYRRSDSVDPDMNAALWEKGGSR
jgi:NADH:ubiquinone oxidoreductase subunit K